MNYVYALIMQVNVMILLRCMYKLERIKNHLPVPRIGTLDSP